MQDRFVVVKIVEVVVDDILASEHLPHSLLNSVTIESHGQNLCPQEDQDSKAEAFSNTSSSVSTQGSNVRQPQSNYQF